MSELAQDLRFSLRILRRSPGYTAVAMATLALGIGANTAVFSFVDNVLLKPLPYPDPDRIVRVIQRHASGVPFPATTLDLLDWQKQTGIFEFVAGQTGWSATLTGSDGSGDAEPVLLRGAQVSASFYGISRIKPLLGRTFLPEEDQYGKDHVVILSHNLWITRFGGDRNIIGRGILLDNAAYTVVGVMPEGSIYDRTALQIAKPLGFSPGEMTRSLHWIVAAGRLKPGVTLEQARSRMSALAVRFEKEYPESNHGFGILVDRLGDVTVGPELRTSLYVLFAAAGMVLLIGCANLANLAMARSVAREREVAVRASLGAGRGRLARQFLTENITLAILGGALGIGLGYVLVYWLRLAIPQYSLPSEVDIRVDGRVLLFALGLSVLTGLLFGLVPALQLTKPDLGKAMKEGGRGSTTSGRRGLLRDALVVAEIAIAFILLTGAGVLIRSFFRLQNVDTGFDARNVLTLGLPTAATQYPDLTEFRNYLREIRTAVDNVPGVRESALTASLPLRGSAILPMQLAGTELVDRPLRGLYFYKRVGPSYFHTLGIPLLQGRTLSDRDLKDSPLVAVINDRMAKRLFPGQSPIGQRILIPQLIPGKPATGPDLTWQVVGVAGNEKVNTQMNDMTAAGVYVPLEQAPVYNPSLAVRADVNPRTLIRPIRQAVDRIKRSQAFSDVQTMEEIKAESIVGTRLQTMLLAIFSGLALLLASLGIYGVISYSVAQRTQELGIRAALGADSVSLMKLVLRSGLVLAAAGLVIGVAGSMALTGLLASLLFGVSARDPETMAIAAATLLAVSLIACYVPARRATQVDPAIALRSE